MSVRPLTSYALRPSTSSSRPSTSRSTTTAKPRTKPTTSTTGPSGDQHIVCALTESRGISPTVGLAFINLTTAEAVLCQISDNQTYVKTLHKLHVFEPSEILFPQAVNAAQNSKLHQVLEASLDIGAPVYAIARKYWDEAEGLAYVENLAFKEDVQSIKVSIGGNFYVCCCFSAALSYIEHTLRLSFASHSIRIKYEPSEGSMMIDVSTIRALELIENIQSSKSTACLFGLLNQTITKMGERLLRSSILQPLLENEIIQKRYDALQELVTHEEIMFAIRKALKSFQDVDKVLTQMVIINTQPSMRTWEQSINHVILVKAYVRAIPSLFDALEGVSSDLLTSIRHLCSPIALEDINKLIDDTINEDVTFAKKPIDLRNQRTYAVKAGHNSLLDVARLAYNEAQQDAYGLLGSLSSEHEIQLEMRYDESRQFYFRFWTSDLEGRTLPDVFINRFRVKNMTECQTLDLIKTNQQIIDSHTEVIHLSEAVVQQLIDDIRVNIAPLFRISDSIAVLDMLGSFAQISSLQDYSRPELSQTLAIKNGRHPITEKIRNEKFIPNDVYATRTQRLQVVTGCNMSGKSTYIRSIALTTIMAQIGCFVPADYASIPIRHQLFARVSLDDSSTSNFSTFAAEMSETAFILHNVDSHSLVIIDELGRGTSVRDGLAIAIAVVEALVKSRALVWFVTHFQDLPIVLAERDGVVSLHLETSMDDPDRMKMLYRIADGPEQQPHYGLALARVACLPESVLEMAEHVAKELTKGKEVKCSKSIEVFDARRRKLLLGLHEQLIQAKEGSLSGEPLRQWLKSLQDEFVVRMTKLDEEQRGAMSSHALGEMEDDPRNSFPLQGPPSPEQSQYGNDQSLCAYPIFASRLPFRNTPALLSEHQPLPDVPPSTSDDTPRSHEQPASRMTAAEPQHSEGSAAHQPISISSQESCSSSAELDSPPPLAEELPQTSHHPSSTGFVAETPMPQPARFYPDLDLRPGFDSEKESTPHPGTFYTNLSPSVGSLDEEPIPRQARTYPNLPPSSTPLLLDQVSSGNVLESIEMDCIQHMLYE